MLRNMVALFSAMLGGAATMTSTPWDQPLGPPSDLGRRIARNAAFVLREESHLEKVVDPAGGSWFLERLTDELAEKSWTLFQEIERQGGMASVLRSGWAAEQIAAAAKEQAEDFACRRVGITGVSEFPQLDEPAPTPQVASSPEKPQAAIERTKSADDEPPLAYTGIRSLMEAAAAGATIAALNKACGGHQGSEERIAPLPALRWSEPFEQLRNASDAWLAAKGRRPTVFLIKLGTPSQTAARAAFAENFFAVGGIAVEADRCFSDPAEAAAAFAASNIAIAVLCSSDAVYAKHAAEVARRCKAAGASAVLLAGKPAEQESKWREAGVDHFLYRHCHAVDLLRDLLQLEGVLAR